MIQKENKQYFSINHKERKIDEMPGKEFRRITIKIWKRYQGIQAFKWIFQYSSIENLFSFFFQIWQFYCKIHLK